MKGNVPEETRSTVEIAVERELAVRRLQRDLGYALTDLKTALVKLDPVDALEYASALSNALEAVGQPFTD